MRRLSSLMKAWPGVPVAPKGQMGRTRCEYGLEKMSRGRGDRTERLWVPVQVA